MWFAGGRGGHPWDDTTPGSRYLGHIMKEATNDAHEKGWLYQNSTHAFDVIIIIIIS
jgi:hypothetical protein